MQLLHAASILKAKESRHDHGCSQQEQSRPNERYDGFHDAILTCLHLDIDLRRTIYGKDSCYRRSNPQCVCTHGCYKQHHVI